MEEENKIISVEAEAVDEVKTDNDVKNEIQIENPNDIVQKKGLNKKLLIVVAGAVAIVALCIVLVIKVVVPGIKYNSAVDAVEAGRYDEAIAIFNEITDYKDVPALIEQTEELQLDEIINSKIESAEKLHQKGDTAGAYKMLADYKDDEEVAGLLDSYAEELLEQVSSKIYYEEAGMAGYNQVSSVESKNEDPAALGVSFVQNKEDPSDNHIYLYYRFYHGSQYSFTTPVHPTVLILQTDNGEMEIPVGLNDRDFTASGGLWFESAIVELTWDQAEVMSKLLNGVEVVNVRAVGASRYHDATVKENGITDVIDYVEVVNLINE